MPEEKLVTVLTPLYNKAAYIKDWAESLAKQTFLDRTKILVTDNCSTDGSVDLLQIYTAKLNLPVEIIYNKKNMGLMYSIKKMYRKLDTKFFAVLDADDYYISPQKLEKAVNFLEAHEDYSCYACNNLSIFSDGRKIPHFPDTTSSTTFSGMKNTPFFQVASTTFRNNFTPKLLDEIDRITKDARRHPFEADAFRNLLAHHFGKFYFENSIDSAWRRDVGIWGTMTSLEQILSNMKSHWVYFEFYIRNFGFDENADYCANLCWLFYNQCLDEFVKQMKALNIFEFEGRPKFRENFVEFGTMEGYTVAKELIEQCKKFKAAGIDIE